MGSDKRGRGGSPERPPGGLSQGRDCGVAGPQRADAEGPERQLGVTACRETPAAVLQGKEQCLRLLVSGSQVGIPDCRLEQRCAVSSQGLAEPAATPLGGRGSGTW